MLHHSRGVSRTRLGAPGRLSSGTLLTLRFDRAHGVGLEIALIVCEPVEVRIDAHEVTSDGD
jgi:hypothetical protein